MKDEIGDQGLDYLDGYDEVPEDQQERIIRLLRDGHVPDEEYNGVR